MTTGKPVRLTQNDIEVLELAALGMSTKDMARHSGKKPQTVSSRVGRAQLKLRARNRTHAVALAMAAGLIQGPEPVACVASRQRSLAEFAEDFKTLSARGLTRPEIAKVMGIKRDTVDRTIWKARRAGLLPRPIRAGVAAC